MKITKKQIKELLKKGNELKLDYPDAFKLEVGKWYKCVTSGVNWLFCFKHESNVNYGFNTNGDWGVSYSMHGYDFELATEQEIRDALIKEAKKRGFKDGVRVKFEDGKEIMLQSNDFTYSFDFNALCVKTKRPFVETVIFKDGKWAEVKEESKEGYVKPILDYTFAEYKKLKGVWTDSVEYRKQLEVKEITLNGVKYKQKKKQ